MQKSGSIFGSRIIWEGGISKGPGLSSTSPPRSRWRYSKVFRCLKVVHPEIIRYR